VHHGDGIDMSATTFLTRPSVVALALVLTLGACGGDDDDSTAKDDRTTTNAASGDGAGDDSQQPDDDGGGPTQAAWLEDGGTTLFVFDGSTVRKVHEVGPARHVGSIRWSPDHTRLIGLDGPSLFSWSVTDGGEPASTTCQVCAPGSVAYLDGPEDLVVEVDYDGTLLPYDAETLEPQEPRPITFPSAGEVGNKTLRGSVDGQLLVEQSGGAHAAETLWIVDPESGEAGASLPLSGQVRDDLAVRADGEEIAFLAGYADCDATNAVYVLGADDLSEVAQPETPAGMIVDEVFFNGDALYATMVSADEASLPCSMFGSSGLWRLGGDTWEQVDTTSVIGARPLEGRTGGADTGWLRIELDGRGSVNPPSPEDPAQADPGPVDLDLGFWSTPTESEVQP
jgi:hypothetical protein